MTYTEIAAASADTPPPPPPPDGQAAGPVAPEPTPADPQPAPATDTAQSAALTAVASPQGQRITARLREYAHDALAIVGLLAIVQAIVLNAIVAAIGHPLPASGITDGFGVAGAAMLGVSKGLDSLNNALRNFGSGTSA